jgi:putative phage-type endonuclease
MKIIDCEQGTPEWFAVRLGKFTASDAQAIAANGKGLETLVFEKVAETMTGKPKESYTNEDMERGKELELSARNLYELETGNLVKEVGFCELDDYTGASPDGMIEKDGLIEIKCPCDTVYVRYLYDKKIETKYFAQMQMQLFVTGREWVEYVVYNPNFDQALTIKRVERDGEFIKKLQEGLEKGKKFLVEVVKSI